MPQLMVSFVGAPAITAGGLFLLFVTAPLMLSAWNSALNKFLQNPFGGVP
jgi:flagellar biosynthetic protein FliR